MEIQLLTFWSPGSRDCSGTQSVSHRVTSITCMSFGLVHLGYKGQWRVRRESSSGLGARMWKSCPYENQLLSVNSGLRDHSLLRHNSMAVFPPIWCSVLAFIEGCSSWALERWACSIGLSLWNFMLDIRLRATLYCSQLLKCTLKKKKME